MSEAAYKRPGETIEETASAAITAGQVEIKAGRCAVATHDFASGEKSVYQISGVFTGTMVGTSEPAANAGDPIWWDSSANKFTVTPVSAAGDCLAGIAVSAIAAAATSAEILLNAYNPDIPVNEWKNKTWEATAANKTLDAQDTGKCFVVTADAKVVTLPATSAGLEYVIACSVADGGALVSISPNASDKIMGPDVAGEDDKDYQLTKATQNRWDYLHVVGDGSAGWYVLNERGTWAQES